MSSDVLPGALLTATALSGLLVFDAKGRWVPWLLKPVASAGFLWVALSCGALETTYGQTVLFALASCWLGDVLLIPKGARRTFLAGLASFLLGHLVFVVAFGMGAFSWPWSAMAAVVVVPAGVVALRWLRPHVSRSFAGPVLAYVLVISAMVLAAAGASGATGRQVILVGAVAFFLSDLAVARERFVTKTAWNRVWGLPLYYVATVLLATSVAG